jgi:hypothetical protein
MARRTVRNYLGIAALALLLLCARQAAADEPEPFDTLPGSVPPDLRVPPYLPAPPPFPPSPGLPVEPAPPASAPAFAPGLPPGPVTNYGTGGMQALPGAPPNPPYPPGGLMR